MKTMIEITQVKVSINDKRTLKEIVSNTLKCVESDILQIHIVKRSLDARKKEDILYTFQSYQSAS